MISSALFFIGILALCLSIIIYIRREENDYQKVLNRLTNIDGDIFELRTELNSIPKNFTLEITKSIPFTVITKRRKRTMEGLRALIPEGKGEIHPVRNIQNERK